jgi:uncharacterized protein (DUF169 family)
MATQEMQYQRGCAGKRKYKTREEAEKIAKLMDSVNQKRELPEWIKANAYMCEFCRFYHIGRLYDYDGRK